MMLMRLKRDLTMAEAARGPGGSRVDLLVVADMVERGALVLDVGPSSALCLYCSTIIPALSGRRNPSDRITTAGPQITACTQYGGWNQTSVRSAPPATIAPTMRMTNTAGPSPASKRE